MSVCHNVAFVVNLHSLDDPKDLRADDNGVWKRMGSPIACVSIHRNHGGKCEAKCHKKWAFTIIITKYQKHYHHLTSPDFRRIITTVQGIASYVVAIYLPQ